MRKVIESIAFVASLLVLSIISQAQSAKDLIPGIQDLMLEHYVFLDKAEKVNTHLDQLLEANYFEEFGSPEELATALREQLQSVTKDKHLRVYPPRQARTSTNTPSLSFNRLSRYYTPMINEFKYFDHNVGYLDMRYFGGGETNIARIDAIMEQLEQADVLIIDMRKNGGGSIRTVNYFLSYFVEDSILLNKIYTRATNETEELWSIPVKGKKRLDAPVYILTSSTTFSGAEDFSYTLQSQRRATIIGEVTRGGAHPTRSHTLAHGFRVSIPFARSINPITKTNWEGVGITPDVEIASEEALEKAIELASAASLKHRNSYFEPLKRVLKSLQNNEFQKEKELYPILDKIVEANKMNERDINRLGYDYFSSQQLPTALAIFKVNTLLFPNSPNAFDSYAEVLASHRQEDLALLNYKKAVSLAKAQQHENLAAYERNLTVLEERMKK